VPTRFSLDADFSSLTGLFSTGSEISLTLRANLGGP
jgi:hypothetical protein